MTCDQVLDLSGLSRHRRLRSRRSWSSRCAPARRCARSRRCWPSATRCWPSSRPISARLLGREAGQGTLVGAVMGNLAGPRRLSAGAARDHLLGFSGVNGRGEAFKSGGKVMKNVTGYDLSKLLAGSWGTLAVLDRGVGEGAAGARPDPHAAAARPRRRSGGARRCAPPWAARTTFPAPPIVDGPYGPAPRRRGALGRGAPRRPARVCLAGAARMEELGTLESRRLLA